MTRWQSPAAVALAAAPVLAAAIGAVGARQAPHVYARLDKPRWAPPSEAFGPVWTALYALLGVAGWRLGTPPLARKVVALHVAQLGINALWPAVFFAGKHRAASLSVISALDATLGAEVALLIRRDPRTAALLSPYLAWCGFATALNAAVSDPGPDA